MVESKETKTTHDFLVNYLNLTSNKPSKFNSPILAKMSLYRTKHQKIPMARQLHLKQRPLSSSEAGLAAVTLLLCAFALFVCASHSRKWRRWSACYGSFDHDPATQLNTEDMMLDTGIYGIHAGSRDDSTFNGEQGAPVWKKNILMGGKCQLPDFSGVIIYDSDGNVVTPAKMSTTRPEVKK